MKKAVKLSMCLASLLFSIHLFAQQGGLNGKIISIEDGSPLMGVNVILGNTGLQTTTDSRGEYHIESIQPKEYVVYVRGAGVSTAQKRITIESGKTLELDFELHSSIEKLSEILIVGNKVNRFSDKRSDYVARMPLSNLENPQVYSVITDELLQEQLITDVKTAIKNAPGISNVVETVGSGGIGLSVSMRGFQTGISMRNGLASNYKTMGDPANIQRIEVIKGPSATLFGSTLTSYGGLVNVVTKKPFDEFKGSIGYSTGSFGLSRFTADINMPVNDDKTLLFRLNAAIHKKESFQDYGVERNWALYPALTYKVNDKLTLNFEAEIFNTNRPSTYFRINPNVDVSGFEDLDYNFNHSFSSDQMQSQAKVLNVFAKAEYKISDQWTSQTNIAKSNTDNDANYLFLNFVDKANARRLPMRITGNFSTLQIQQNFIGQFKIGKANNKLLIGLDYTQLDTRDRRTRFVYDTVSSASADRDFNFDKYMERLGETDPYAKFVVKQKTYSAYVSDVLSFKERLFLMASLRVDYFSNELINFDQTAYSPKLGAVYQVVDNKVSLFANYMDGFKNIAPDNTDPDHIISFKPEHATQIEGGVKMKLLDDKLSATLSYYDITVRDIVRSVPDPDNIGGFNAVQDGTRVSRGVEIEVIANPFEGWNILAGYSYNDSEYTKAAADIVGNRPYGTPEHTVNFWTSYRFSTPYLHGLGVGFGGNYVSEFFQSDANTFTVPERVVLNASLFFERSKYRIGLKWNNITDEQYWVSDFWARPQDPSNVVLSFDLRF